MGNRKITLRVYVDSECMFCDEALRIAADLREKFVQIEVDIVDVEAEEGSRPWPVFAVPTYTLDGRIIALGNPDAGQLEREVLRSLAAR